MDSSLAGSRFSSALILITSFDDFARGKAENFGALIGAWLLI